MGYPSPLKVVSRKLTNDIVISSCPFTRVDRINFGGRMALFNYSGQIIVWSALPYGPEVEKSLELLTGTNGSHNITHLIIPDKEHTMAAKSFKDAYPDLKVLAMEGVEVPGLAIDYRVTSNQGNKTIDSKILREEIGITDEVFLNSFEFVYLPHHTNKELVMFDTKSKILFEADLLFNLGVKDQLEQFSPATGYPKDYNPHTGWSFVTRYMQPYSKVGNFLANKVVTPKSKPGLEAIQKWDFSQIVMCHGNVIDKDAKKAFRNVFNV